MKLKTERRSHCSEGRGRNTYTKPIHVKKHLIPLSRFVTANRPARALAGFDAASGGLR